jgi:hypothetical protein
MVYDAGTEVNDEVPESTAFLKQMMPNTGQTENGVVHRHPGFLGSVGLGGGSPGNILQAFPGADFTQPDAVLATISIQAVPEPSTMALVGIGVGVLLARRLRRRA